jgi:hypothetical protein
MLASTQKEIAEMWGKNERIFNENESIRNDNENITVILPAFARI